MRDKIQKSMIFILAITIIISYGFVSFFVYSQSLSILEADVCQEAKYIEKAIVTTKKNDNKVSRIIAFVKIKSSYSVESKEIKEYLKRVLPEYMIPNIKMISEIPLTANGKVDAKKLLEEY